MTRLLSHQSGVILLVSLSGAVESFQSICIVALELGFMQQGIHRLGASQRAHRKRLAVHYMMYRYAHRFNNVRLLSMSRLRRMPLFGATETRKYKVIVNQIEIEIKVSKTDA